MTQKVSEESKNRRAEIFEEIITAFGEKYGWLGAQASREMLVSAATWNIQKYSNPPFRFRTHLMLAWQRGYFKSTMMRKMADILGDDFCSVIGKVSEAAMRGSVSGGTFTPPKPLRTPIVISTEFGQTSFDDELLNLFLNQLEEGHTNVALNKIGSLGESQKREIEEQYGGDINFGASNEFDLKCDFIFWGATYDPSKLSDDALRSRFRVVTPSKPLNYEVTLTADNAPPLKSMISRETTRDLRRELRSEREVSTDFQPPEKLYRKYDINPRESRDVHAYMAARNWWGLNTDPEVMEKFIQHLQESRRVSTMKPEERVFDIIFETPKTYGEIMEQTGLDKKEIYKILQRLDATPYNLNSDMQNKWVIWSGDGEQDDEDDEDDDDGFLAHKL